MLSRATKYPWRIQKKIPYAVAVIHNSLLNVHDQGYRESFDEDDEEREERERLREEQANGHPGELISQNFEEEKEELADQRWIMVKTMWEGYRKELRRRRMEVPPRFEEFAEYR